MKASVILIAVVPAFAGLALAACGSDDSTSSGAPADAGVTADSSSGVDARAATDSGTGADSAPSDAASSSDAASDGASEAASDAATGDAAVSLDCASYCSEVLTNCTGAQAQFTDMATCMGFCAEYPKGALGDTSGDTLGCRIYHGGAPAKSNPTLHCPHAGPTGGDLDPKGTTGVCGEPCDAFCATALVVCQGQASAYANLGECTAECKLFNADTTAYSTADTSKNDMGCRFYHLSAAAAGAGAAATHCPHIRATSTVCTM